MTIDVHESSGELSPSLKLTYDCLTLLQDWGADFTSTAKILGFPEGTRARQIRKYYEGLKFPDDDTVFERARTVIKVGDALRTTYPSSQQMRSMWMNTPHKRFGGLSPMQRITRGDTNALEAVLVLVDCAYGWQLSQ